jgi:hypothetical protein
LNIYWISALVVGVIIILILAFYALKLTKQVKVVEADRERRLAELETRGEAVLDDVARGIAVIANAYLQEDLTATEACLRIEIISQQLQLETYVSALHPVIWEIAEKTRHLPILQAYKDLSRKEQHRVDLERIRIETEYEAALNASMEGLKNFVRPKFDNAAV